MSKCNGQKLHKPGDFPHSGSKEEQNAFWKVFHRYINSFEYEEECTSCGKKHYLQTQEDKNPEYYTEVYLRCSCGQDVLFNLPVN